MSQITVVGNLTADPELRYTNAGKAVANFTVAESQRVKDSDGNWSDGPSTFWRVSLWDSAAENLTESLVRGQRVIVVGEAKQRSWETNTGEKRSVIEITATEVGPSLRWATAKLEKTGGKPKPKQDDPWTSQPADDSVPF